MEQFSRRDWMKLASAGVLGGSAVGWFETLAMQAAAQAPAGRPAKSMILLWMAGGPSQTDTFDMKPGHANAGEFSPIDTNVPGVQICEHLPRMARQMDKVALVRGMNTIEADHHRATYLMRTGYRQVGGTLHPAFGSIVSKEVGKPDFELPNFVWIGNRNSGAGFLGAQHSPFVLASDVTRGVENVRPFSQMDAFEQRFYALNQLSEHFAVQNLNSEAPLAHGTAYQQAARLMRSNKLQAFDITREPQSVLGLYGNTRFGRQCLLARRLVEVGVPFVGICMDADWDTHVNNWNRMRPYLPDMDRGWAGLLEDLQQRGMLQDTLVVWMGEFGRDPRINKGAMPGREHFARAWTTAFSGGGVRGGQVIGRTDPSGMEVADRPVRTGDFMATLCRAMGIDHNKSNVTPDGRPIRLAENGGPVEELFA